MTVRYVWCAFTIVVLLSGCAEEQPIPWGSGFVETTKTLVSAESSGRIERMRFDEADYVSRGDTIAMIDTTLLALRLRQAEAAYAAAQTKRDLAAIDIDRAEQQLALAKKEYDRIEQLLPSGSVTQQQYDVAETQLAQARLSANSTRAALAAAEAEMRKAHTQTDLLAEQLRDCFLTAPITGVIVERFMDPGELASPGNACVEIAALDTVWVKIYLPPDDLTRITLGATAEVDSETEIEPLPGTVRWIASEAEFTPKNVQTKEARADLVYAVKVTVPNPQQRLKVGMPVVVRIP